jgi:hypothetical protein
MTFAGNLWAIEPTQPVASAKTREQVQEALQREVYGLGTERHQLLSAAIEAEPQASLPRWYQGQVQGTDGQWKLVDKPISAREGQLYREYVDFRNSKPDDAAGQKAIADWCEKKGLKQQERAHLIRSLMFNPNQAAVKGRLDMVKVGNEWIDKGALAREEAHAKAVRASNEYWAPIVAKLATQVTAADKDKRQAAIDQVLAIRDPGALPVLQQVFGSQGEEHELLVLRVASKMSDLAATHLIAYLAAECPVDKVRKEAAQLLKSRDLEDYAPLLIGEMYAPVKTTAEAELLSDGSLTLQRRFVREGATHVDLFISHAHIVPFKEYIINHGKRGPDQLVRGSHRAQFGAGLATMASEIAVSEQNRDTKLRNERITEALVTATGVELAAQPDLWWKWWMDLNELTLPNGKSLDVRVQQGRIATFDPVLDPHSSQTDRYVYFRPPVSCLHAGTPIWTEQGPVAVELVNVGDLVLSRNIETGELAYKPVLLTTIRPKRQLTEFAIGEEKIQATAGHLFWVSGKGWVRTRELQPSQVMHTASDPVSVAKVGVGTVAQTYNLVVDDFHTYFVGEHKLLSHDNTPRQPTSMVVPGLLAE